MRWTEEYLEENEDLAEIIRGEVLSQIKLWSLDHEKAGINLYTTYEFYDRLPISWIVNTYFNRFRHGDEDKELFAEQIILPYCIERGLIKKAKNGSYVANTEIEQTPELNFPD
jgi:hypothetical protein